jgi:hypothetical protein
VYGGLIFYVLPYVKNLSRTSMLSVLDAETTFQE